MTLTILDARPNTDETTRATVLFADLRGYTRLAEQVPPARVVVLLEEFFSVLAKATEMHGGQIFHMAGDGMMAGFGVGDRAKDGAREALASGRAMLTNFASVARRWQRELSIDTAIGVGIHLGEVALGLLGPPGRQAPTLVGDTVNVAARLCSRARAGEVLFSSMVATALVDDTSGATGWSPQFRQLPQFELRGRNAPVDVWCVPAPKRLPL